MDALEQLLGTSAAGLQLMKHLKRAQEDQDTLASLITSVVKELLSQPGRLKERLQAENVKPAGTVFCSLEATCLAPRGKFTLSFAENALLLGSSKNNLQVPWEAIKAVAIIDNIPKDTRGRVLLFLHLGSDGAAAYGKQTLEVLVIQSLASEQLELAGLRGSDKLQGPAPVVLCQALGISRQPNGLSFSSPGPEHFQSSSGASAVDAVVKVNQGHLYPLADALCFLEKPALFIPLSEIASVELCRAGGVSITFDLQIHCKNGRTQEFSNIPKAEIGAIRHYIAARGLHSGGPDSLQAQQAQQLETGGNSSEEDSDFDPDRDEDEEDDEPAATTSGHHRSVANATQASQAEDDDAASEDIENEDEDEEDEEDESDADSGDVSLISESLVSDDDDDGGEAGEANKTDQRAKRQKHH